MAIFNHKNVLNQNVIIIHYLVLMGLWPLVIHSINFTLGQDLVFKLSLSETVLLLHCENCAVLRVL